MEKSIYLSSGEKLGGHYEIIEVLGNDDFEILYLARDRHLGEKLFVLKELFLKDLSLRDEDGSVYTLAKSKYIFEETKKEVVLENRRLQESNKEREIQIYGYFEENNTIYTIMEFINDANSLDHYLNIKSTKKEEEIALPPLGDLGKEEPKNNVAKSVKKEKKKSTIFLKVLIVSVLIFSALAYYAFKIIQEDKAKSQEKPSTTTVEVIPNTPKPIHHPPLTNRDKNKSTLNIDEDKKDREKNETKTDVVTPNSAEFIPPTTDAYQEEKIESHNKTTLDNDMKIEEKPSFEYTTQVDKQFTRNSIKSFLDRFVNSLSRGSVDSVLSHYDTHVDRYFLSTNVTQEHIRKEIKRYNQKWKERDFRVENFVILKMYKKNGTDYCKIANTIKWSVSTENIGADFGKNRGLMTLKRTPNGFKITSIATK